MLGSTAVNAKMFVSARLKIKRAHHHIDDLNGHLAAFCNSDFYDISIQKDGKTGNDVIQFLQTRTIPVDIALIVGDAIHNARTAIDHMMCEIVKIRLGIDSKYSKFPFDETRKQLIARINGGVIKGIGDDLIGLIVDEIRPYQEAGGDQGLCALHDMDIADKHVLPIPVFTVSQVNGIAMKGGKATINNMSIIPMPGWMGRHLVGITDGELKITNKGKATANIIFNEGQAFWGQPVIPTLFQLTDLVTGIVDAFEAALVAKV